MRHQFIILFLFVTTWFSVVSAQTQPTDYRGFGTPRYSLRVMADYGYNRTWGSMGNLNLHAIAPVNPHFEALADVQLSTANIYTVALTARPKFTLPAGELFIDTRAYYRAVVRASQWDAVAALSLGYRMDYVSVQIGLFSRVMGFYGRNWHSTDAFDSEPFNLLYNLQVFARPQDCPWNISLSIANMDEFQYERMWAPFFTLGARYDINDHWRLDVATQLKLTGMFHLNAEFYSANARVGFTYRF